MKAKNFYNDSIYDNVVKEKCFFFTQLLKTHELPPSDPEKKMTST